MLYATGDRENGTLEMKKHKKIREDAGIYNGLSILNLT